MLQDLRFGLRSLLKTPGFTLTALIALALGIGANTAIFSVVSPVLFKPLPFPDPERVVMLVLSRNNSPLESNFSLPTYRDFEAQQHALEAVAGMVQGSVVVSTPTEPVRVRGLFATGGLTGVMKLPPTVGRNLTVEDDAAGAADVAVLSHWVWSKHFAADPAIVGRTVAIDGRSFTVVGVANEALKLLGQGKGPGLIAPLRTHNDVMKFGHRRGHHNMVAIGRVKGTLTLAQATKDAEAAFEAIEKAAPDETGLRPALYDLRERMTGDMRPVALLLLAAVALVLLLACANVAGLLVVRAGARQREISIRLALGASRLRVVRQVLTEAMMLSVAGAALGLLVALWTLDGLKVLVGNKLPEVGLDAPVLAFTALIGVVTGLAFGAVPALHASRVGLHEALQDAGNRSSQSKTRRRAQAGLIAVQIALAFALLSGAGLMFRSLYLLMHESVGFDPEHLVSVRLRLPEFSYSPEQKRAFYRRALEVAAALPGVEAVGSGDPFPFLDGNSRNSVYPAGKEPAPGEELHANMYEVSETYFDVMKIPLREGRTFAPNEREPEHRNAVIISEKLARQFWPGESALGKKLVGIGPEPLNVIAVVGDVKHGSLDSDVRMALYVPWEQSQWLNQRLLLRTRGPPEDMEKTVERMARSLDPSLPAAEAELATEVLKDSASTRRLALVMLAAFAAVALLLSALGLWGLIAYAVGQRRQELAIRAALGAPAGHLIGLVLGQGVALIAGGLVGGVALAVLGSRVLKALLYGVEAVDPATYGAIAVLLSAVALLACWLPARAATRVDPNAALRA